MMATWDEEAAYLLANARFDWRLAASHMSGMGVGVKWSEHLGAAIVIAASRAMRDEARLWERRGPSGPQAALSRRFVSWLLGESKRAMRRRRSFTRREAVALVEGWIEDAQPYVAALGKGSALWDPWDARLRVQVALRQVLRDAKERWQR